MSRRKLYVRLVVSMIKRKKDGSDFLSKVPENYRWPWIGFILAAGDSKVPGKLCIEEGIPYHEDQLARLLDTAYLKEAVKWFLEKEMIMYDENGVITIIHWELYQTEWERLQKYLTDKDLPTTLPTGLPTQIPHSVPVYIIPNTKDSNKDLGLKTFTEEFLKKWNSKLFVSKIHGFSEKRKKAVNERLKEAFWKENWFQAIDRMEKSDFLTGKTKLRVDDKYKGWKPDFDFFFRPDTVLKIMEGKYDNKGAHMDPEQEKRNERIANNLKIAKGENL